MVLLFLLLLLPSEQGILERISENNKAFFTDSKSSYYLGEESASKIVTMLNDNRQNVVKEILKIDKKFSLDNENSFKILERIDLPYNNIKGIVWSDKFVYCFTKTIGADKLEVCKLSLKKIDKSGIAPHIFDEVEKWNLTLLKKMVSRPVDKWDESYTNFLDSLKTNTTYNIIQTGDAFYLATKVDHNQVSSIAFDGF
ncbi:MAG TPA: hypothetical protein PKL56_18225 [Cyclobacteriaceae bacterium]|nr:hypothetical protein [Cyclobacteriaceae bacterium]HMX00949.1 hypothetical protein [Cyclobacteriaceae bacterium]HMX50008.1 hypothetical protein [Cyclobacteriaceae bacterium]HMY93753.1 hypothetical protein [Cyclobacteriaceae bacterium]HNA12592.1 hypothetical protein [Cyclobacteriaceae bacterium]